MIRRAVPTVALLAIAAAPSAANPSAEREVTGDGIVPVVINGTALRLRVEPGAPGLPTVAPAVAARLGLKGGGLLAFGVAFRIGQETVYGRTQTVKIAWDGARATKRRVGWTSRDFLHDVDGTVGPAGLPEPVIRFRLGPSLPGERVTTLPMAGGGGLFGDWFVLGTTITVDGQPLRVTFNPARALTTATAPAAARIATVQGGHWTDGVTHQLVAFGIERPLRVMALAQPLAIGPLRASSIAVRTTDGRGASSIPDGDADPSEVVVTARPTKAAGLLTVGHDLLARCSSLVFDKPAKQVRLTCE